MNNEERILSILEEHSKLLEAQGKTLEEHSKLLEAQGKTLEEHSKLLEAQGKTLEKHSRMLEAQGKTLEEHSTLLEAQGRLLEKLDAKIDEKAAEARSQAIAYTEAAIIPKLELLAEGQQTLLETLAPRSRVEALEEEVDFLKTVVRAMSRDIAELKKAQ